jgi:hypothetical protein
MVAGAGDKRPEAGKSADEPAFLSDCPEVVRAFYRYWDGKRRGRPMPARADLDPGEIKSLLPNMMIVDVVPDERRFVYRLVGTMEVEVRGNDPTGKTVLEAAFGGSKEKAVANYERVVRERAPWRQDLHAESPDGRLLDDVVLFLPLSDDGETVNKIVVYSHQVRQY